MSALQWSEALSLDLPVMDETHREFVDMLAAVIHAPQEQQLDLWNQVLEHTRDHFGREDDWMIKTRFSSCQCHSGQHHVVLQVMQEIGERAAKGEMHLLADLSKELGQWFVQHAQSMDAALALHMRRVGYDAATGDFHLPEGLAQAPAHGCHTAHHTPEHAHEAATA
jgi:hemerythrin-like metal-binding protein